MFRLPALCLLAVATPSAMAAEPIALHPQNGHYFLWRGRPTILITSGEHYGAVLNLDFDFVRYLDDLGRRRTEPHADLLRHISRGARVVRHYR